MKHIKISIPNEWIDLFNAVSIQERSALSIFEDVIHELDLYDKGLYDKIVTYNLQGKIYPYFIYYVLPLHELMQIEGKPYSPKVLTLQLIACLSWRSFDNSIDSHTESPQSEFHLISLYNHLLLFSLSTIGNNNLGLIERHFEIMADMAEIEKNKAIPIQDLWKRCSIFLYVAEDLLQLSDQSIKVFKDYINYNGIAHDLHDFYTDIVSGTQSLPVTWMREINSHLTFDKQSLCSVYEIANREIRPIAEFFSKESTNQKYPITCLLLNQAKTTLNNSEYYD